MSGAYYNEIDPFAAAWLRELIKKDLIAPGEVDERSIEEVKPDDLRGFTQCHFFAGIGVWSYALRNAGWSDASPVWTGSCPCQGFSASGQREGFSDKRHLWPAWFRLISERRPVTVFGEQVASKDGLAWLDVVSADMEGEGYAIGATDICAAGVGAPHIRQRLYFVADSQINRTPDRSKARQSHAERDGDVSEREHPAAFGLPQRTGETALESQREPSRQAQQRSSNARYSPDSNGGNASTEGLQRSGEQRLCAEDSEPRDNGDAEIIGRHGRENNQDEGRRKRAPGQTSKASDCLDSDCSGSFAGQQAGEGMGYGSSAEPTSSTSDSLNTSGAGLPQRERVRRFQQEEVESQAGQITERTGDTLRDWRGLGWLEPAIARAVSESGATHGFWSDCDWWYGRDGKYRPIGAGLFPLVAGATGRMGKLRGYGNALCAPQAQAFIEAYMSI